MRIDHEVCDSKGSNHYVESEVDELVKGCVMSEAFKIVCCANGLKKRDDGDDEGERTPSSETDTGGNDIMASSTTSSRYLRVLPIASTNLSDDLISNCCSDLDIFVQAEALLYKTLPPREGATRKMTSSKFRKLVTDLLSDRKFVQGNLDLTFQKWNMKWVADSGDDYNVNGCSVAAFCDLLVCIAKLRDGIVETRRKRERKGKTEEEGEGRDEGKGNPEGELLRSIIDGL